jgi:hypothetical protein
MSFSVGSNFLMSNFVAPGTFSTTTAPAGGVPTGQAYQMNDGQNQYFNTSGIAWGNKSLIMADAGDVIHLSGGGWDAGVDASTDVANGIGHINGKLYTKGDKQVFVYGGAHVDTADENAQANKDALNGDISAIENDATNLQKTNGVTDKTINKAEIQQALDDNKFSGNKKTFWQSVLAGFDSYKNSLGLIDADQLAKYGFENQA